MSPRTASRLAWSILLVTVALAAVDAGLALSNRRAWGLFETYGFPAEGALLAVVAGTMGFLVVRRQPRNPVGWLLFAQGLGMLAAYLPKDWAIHTIVIDPRSLPWGTLAAWTGGWLWIVGVAPVLYLILLFPDGKLPGPRWRVVAWVGGFAVVALATVAAAAQHGLGARNLANFGSPANQIDPGWRTTIQVTFGVGLVLVLSSVASVVIRLRRATGELRQQLKWFAYAGTILVIATVVVDGVLYFVPALGDTPSADTLGAILGIGFLGLMLAIGVAMMKYRLYDIDVVINRTLVVAALAVFITTVYVAIVVVLGRVLLPGDEVNPVLSIAATALLAVAFHPVRERVQRFANRLVYGERATPYEVMALFSHRMAEALSVEEVLPRMAEAAATGVGGTAGRVRLLLQDGGERAVRWPVDAEEDPAHGYDRTLAISHLGETIGELAVAKAPGEPVTAGDDRLLEDLVGQAGIALHNVRLTIELSRRLEEISTLASKLRASRTRIVAAQDDERRRLELRIRDETEPQLRSIAERLALVEQDLTTDPAGAAALLDQVATEADATLDGLRDLARGIFPPLLTDQGLVPAIEAQIRKSSVNATLEADGVAGRRFDPRAEAAAYFVCVEALRYGDEMVPGVHLDVSLSADEEWLHFAVSGPGQPRTPEAIAAGRRYQPLVDRVEALGGSVEVRWLPEGRTELAGKVPRVTADSSLVQTS